MRKNGFTLAELLGVITLLGLLALIIIPTVDRNLKEGKNELYEAQIKSIKASAQMWGTDHIGELPNNGETITITLERLIQDGYVSEDIENPVTGEAFDTNLEIRITSHGTYYSYEVFEK